MSRNISELFAVPILQVQSTQNASIAPPFAALEAADWQNAPRDLLKKRSTKFDE